MLDGWQRPVVDPLPAVGEAAFQPGPAPTPPVTAVPVETENAGPTGPGPPPVAVPSADQGRLLFWLAGRILLLVVALGLLLAGFLHLPLLASIFAVHFATPHADIKGVHPGGGGLAVFAGFLALFVACPSFNKEPNPAPPGSK